MNHIDITFDLETTATTANAAVMQIAAVAWRRDAEDDPFLADQEMTFNRHVDLRTCVVEGFDFDQQTIDWWSRQSETAKNAVTADFCEPINDVFADFIRWIGEVKNAAKAESICLWCQGQDFDGAILRNICHKYKLRLPFKFQQFRDCRTVILEAAAIRASATPEGNSLPSAADILSNDRRAYDLYDQLPDTYASGHEAHDALYDCLRSSYNVWQALRWLSK